MFDRAVIIRRLSFYHAPFMIVICCCQKVYNIQSIKSVELSMIVNVLLDYTKCTDIRQLYGGFGN